jgi:ABC-2 type transport system permease protein
MPSPITYLSQVLALIRKEMLAILKDPASRALLFAPALISRCCSVTAQPMI